MSAESTLLSSRERHYTGPNPLRRLGMWAFFTEVSRALPEVASVLDAGCGEGYAMRRVLAARPGLHVIGTDLSPEALRRAAEICPQASAR